MSPRIILPLDETGEFTDQIYIGLSAMKEQMNVWVETEDGWKLPITFMTPLGMQDNIESMRHIKWNYHFYFEGLILVEAITWGEVNRALENTWAAGYFKTKPIPPSTNIET